MIDSRKSMSLCFFPLHARGLQGLVGDFVGEKVEGLFFSLVEGLHFGGFMALIHVPSIDCERSYKTPKFAVNHRLAFV